MALQHLRSSTANKRPLPAGMSDGQLAVNTNNTSPGLFFKNSAGALVKVGPVHVGATAPNASPAGGGETGNSVGEQWLDTSGTNPVLKIWDGSAWQSETGEFVNASGDTMTGALVMDNQQQVRFRETTANGTNYIALQAPAAVASDKTLTLPDVTGTLVSTGDTGSVTSTMIADGTIVNADINASAAIAGSKIQAASTSNAGAVQLTDSTSSTSTTTAATPNAVKSAYDLANAALPKAGGALTGDVTLNAQSDLRFADADSSNWVALQGPATVSSNVTWTLPSADGTSGQVLSTNGSGTLSWATAANGSGTSITQGNTTAEVIDTGSDGRFVVTTEGTERLRVDSSGRLGVGTASPGEPLSVATSSPGASATLARLQNTGTTSGTEARLLLSTSTSTGGTVSSGIACIATDAVGNTALALGTGTAGSYSEKARLDSSGRLLVGTSSTSGNATLHVNKGSAVGTDAGGLLLTNMAAMSSIGAGDDLGYINFGATTTGGVASYDAARILCEADATWGTNDYPSRLVFSTTADGASSPTERFTILQSGHFKTGTLYNRTSAVAANVYVDSDTSLYRATSSGKYKTDVETLEDTYADALLECRPVWYRSLCEGDNPNHGWWGFIAEEVAEIDPRLVHWKTTEISYDDKGSMVETPCEPEPEGVQYDRFVPHLLNLIKRQKEQIEAMEARLTALESA